MRVEVAVNAYFGGRICAWLVHSLNGTPYGRHTGLAVIKDDVAILTPVGEKKIL